LRAQRHLTLQCSDLRCSRTICCAGISLQRLHFPQEHAVPLSIPQQSNRRNFVVLALAAQHDTPVLLHLAPARSFILVRVASIVRQGQHLQTLTSSRQHRERRLSLALFYLVYDQHPIQGAECSNLWQDHGAIDHRQLLGEAGWQGLYARKFDRTIVDNSGDFAGDATASAAVIVFGYLK
jgi:hypothetical protein